MASRAVTVRGPDEAVPEAAAAATAGRDGASGPAGPVAPETERDAGDPRAVGEAEDVLRMRRMQRRQISHAEDRVPTSGALDPGTRQARRGDTGSPWGGGNDGDGS
jgi:hypothetical protein